MRKTEHKVSPSIRLGYTLASVRYFLRADIPGLCCSLYISEYGKGLGFPIVVVCAAIFGNAGTYVACSTTLARC